MVMGSTSGREYSSSGADFSIAGWSASSLHGYTGYGMYFGGDGAHNNMQPYQTVYYWTRTA